ncbi:MAG: acyl-CoA thioesterase [Myxococcales bacterium]|nr:acyl-CoA thioesterase [Myxococcales bacterium]
MQLRVIYGDTDQMGVVYYANYLRWFEAARGGFLRDRGASYGEIEAEGYALPVVEAHARYLRPARYDDLVDITPRVTKVRGASLRFEYRVARMTQGGGVAVPSGGEELLATGFTVHACLDRRGRPTRLPPLLLRLLDAAAGV